MRRPGMFLALAVVTLSWSGAIAAAPAAKAPILSAFTYAAGSLVCHQRPERSFHYGNAQYPVCARCQGLYAGAVLGVGLWAAIAGAGRAARAHTIRQTSINVVRRTLMLTALPTAVTVAIAWLGWWDASNAFRAALAVPFGAAITMAITAVAVGDLR